MFWDIVLWSLAVILIVLGIAGNILPVLPGAPLVLAGLFLGAWADGFVHVGWWTMGVIGALTLLTMALDFLAASLGAKGVGASTAAVWGAALGGIAGIFFGLWGVVLGPFVGAALGEYWHRRKILRAAHVGLATWVGLAVGAAGKVALCFIMVGVFFLDLWLW